MTFDREFRKYLEEAIGTENARIAFSAFEQTPAVSVRLNPSKPGAEFGCGQDRIPWCGYGLMLDTRPQFTLDPCLHAGAYYVQDSSSMFTGHVFRHILRSHTGIREKNIRVLDLCAAPGGKTTDMAASLRDICGDRFLLVSNEVIRQRAGILADNVSAWGDPNVMVTSSDPERIGRLKGMFDIIVADVPCSGEGMFRKDPEAIRQWSPDTVSLCQARQRRIIADIWDALADGGILIYSTCTFNRYENDLNVGWICCELGASPVSGGDATPGDMPGVLKTEYGFLLVPGLVRGEGQYCSAVKKDGHAPEGADRKQTRRKDTVRTGKGTSATGVVSGMFDREMRISERAGEIIAVPETIADDAGEIAAGITVMSSGCAAGSMKGRDFIPSQDLALSAALSGDAFPETSLDEATALAYLHRDQINPACPCRGFIRVTYKGLGLGFIKNIGNRCNNMYPMSRRIRMDIPKQ